MDSADRKCLTCGVSIAHRYKRSKRCEPCQHVRMLAMKAALKRKKNRAGRKCTVCDILIPDRHALALRCADCQKALQAKRQREWLTSSEQQGAIEERRLKHNERARQYRARNAERVRAQDRARQSVKTQRERERYKNDEVFREKKKQRARQRGAKTGYERRRKIRTALLARDGATCSYCNKPLTEPLNGRKTHIDHIVPMSRGGSNKLDNLQLLHGTCNMKKGVKEWHKG